MSTAKMSGSKLLAALFASILVSSPALAQQPPGANSDTPASSTERFDPSSITPSPAVQQMVQGLQSNQKSTQSPVTISKLTGYVGPSTADTVKLYWDLSLSRYWEIPRSAIRFQIPASSPDDPVHLYVPSTTAIAIINTMPAEAAVIQRGLISQWGTVIKNGEGDGENDPITRNAALAAGESFLRSAAIECLAGMGLGCMVSLGSGLALGIGGAH
jgi:hypothetical protein